MSAKPLIELLLERFSKGDRDVLSKLCAQLADRLLIVPSLSQQADGNTTKVSVLQLKIEELPAIACFTSEKRFTDWKELFDLTYDKLDLLGADLGIVIGKEKGLIIDPGSSHESILSPEEVTLLSQEPESPPEPVEEKPLPRPTLLEVPPLEPRAKEEQKNPSREVLINADAILAGDQDISEDPETGRRARASRVLEQPEYESQTLVHNGPIDAITSSVVMEKIAPFTPEPFEPLPPEASELPPEVARRVAKLVAQSGNKKSGAIYRPDEKTTLSGTGTHLTDGRSKKRRGLFSFFKSKKS